MSEPPITLEQAEAELAEWARIAPDRDQRVRRARAAGMSKYRINQITGITRPTLDRILGTNTTPPA